MGWWWVLWLGCRILVVWDGWGRGRSWYGGYCGLWCFVLLDKVMSTISLGDSGEVCLGGLLRIEYNSVLLQYLRWLGTYMEYSVVVD